MFDKPLDTGNEKHMKRSDILGIFISLGLGVFTILTGSGIIWWILSFCWVFPLFLNRSTMDESQKERQF